MKYHLVGQGGKVPLWLEAKKDLLRHFSEERGLPPFYLVLMCLLFCRAHCENCLATVHFDVFNPAEQVEAAVF